MPSSIEIGSKVAYSVQFLESIAACHTEMAHRRGVVTGMQTFGLSSVLARVQWEPDYEILVNVSNLAIVGPNAKFCKC